MKQIKRFVSLILVAVTLLGLTVMPASAASTTAFDHLNEHSYAKTFTLHTDARTIPYTGPDLKYRGTVTYGRSENSYIDNNTDELYLMDVGTENGQYWALVSYPTSRGRVRAYIYLSTLTENNGSHAKATSTGRFYCATRKNSGLNTSYYVDKGDTTYLVATSGSRYQILYNISGGKWRLAWCDASDYNKYCAPKQSNNSGVDVATPAGMVDVTAYFAGKTVQIKSVENGRYLCADTNIGGHPLRADRSAASTWETFTMSGLTSDGWLGIKTHTGQYLMACHGEKDDPIASRSNKLLSWECHRIYQDGNGYFYIRSQMNMKFWCVRVDRSNAPVQAYASVPSTWERVNIQVVGERVYVSPAEICRTAAENGIQPGTNAYKALLSLNTKYASKLTDSDRRGTVVALFEGVGNKDDASVRMNAMCLVIRNGDIVYCNRNSTTIPDAPFDPSRNQGTNMPTLISGVYSYTTVNHHGKYAALNVLGDRVLRFRNRYSYYESTSGQINVHRRDSDTIKSYGTPNSAGCMNVGIAGTASTGEYARFIQAVGIVGGSAGGAAKFTNTVRGKIIIDRTYARDYLRAVGYCDDAINILG